MNSDDSDKKGESPLFSKRVISSHLQSLGYPEKSLINMLKCGEDSYEHIIAECDCGGFLLDLKHKCSLRTCPSCSKKRKRRIRRKYLPFLQSQKITPTNFLYFLTISPKNYPSLREGLEHIRKSFSRFLRLQYIKERVDAGLYVIESKQSSDGSWNIHIHAIIYGRWLDNRIRGFCLDCNRPAIMKYDYSEKKYYCANAKCKSTNVIVNENSKLVELWRASSGREVNMNIQKQSSVSYTLNYMLKYISANKDDFATPEAMADYIFITRKRKLINTFGKFFKYKPPEDHPKICPNCNKEIHYYYDYEVKKILLASRKPPEYDPGNGISELLPWQLR